MGGLDSYLSGLLSEFGKQLPGAYNQLPVVYGNRIFPQLASIIARYSLSNQNEDRVNRRLASAR